MKKCMVCGFEKSFDEFRMRVRPPIRLYAACKNCEPMAYRKQLPLTSEYMSLRDKAISLRKMTPEQDVEAFRRHVAGEKQKSLAKEFGVSAVVVSRAIKRGRAASKS